VGKTQSVYILEETVRGVYLLFAREDGAMVRLGMASVSEVEEQKEDCSIVLNRNPMHNSSGRLSWLVDGVPFSFPKFRLCCVNNFAFL